MTLKMTKRAILTIANDEAEDLQYDREVFVHQDHPLQTLWL